jgi:hypothetical protein
MALGEQDQVAGMLELKFVIVGWGKHLLDSGKVEKKQSMRVNMKSSERLEFRTGKKRDRADWKSQQDFVLRQSWDGMEACERALPTAPMIGFDGEDIRENETKLWNLHNFLAHPKRGRNRCIYYHERARASNLFPGTQRSMRDRSFDDTWLAQVGTGAE